MNDRERRRRPNSYIRSGAERGAEVLAHYLDEVMGSYAREGNPRVLGATEIIKAELPVLICDLALLADYAGQEWSDVVREAEAEADEERLLDGLEAFGDES